LFDQGAWEKVTAFLDVPAAQLVRPAATTRPAQFEPTALAS
jgi:hypothetical protein